MISFIITDSHLQQMKVTDDKAYDTTKNSKEKYTHSTEVNFFPIVAKHISENHTAKDLNIYSQYIIHAYQLN